MIHYKYFHHLTNKWMEQTKFYLGEQIPYEDASIVDRVHHELCNSSWGGIYQTGRATGQSVYPIHKMLSYYPIIGPSLRGATMPSINTVDPRDIYCTTGIGNAPLISKRTLNNTLNENQLYRSDLGFRSNSIGSSDTETNNLFFRTNITADKINSSNTLLGLPSGLFAFGFSLNSTPVNGTILGYNANGSIWAHVETGLGLTVSIKGASFGFDINLPANQTTTGTYLVSRRSATGIFLYKNGVYVTGNTVNTATCTGNSEIAFLARLDSPTGIAGRYTAWVSDIYFTAGLIENEEIALADIFYRQQLRRQSQ